MAHPNQGPTGLHGPYEPPTVVDFGALQEVTAGMSAGTVLDQTFPTGTNSDQLLFS